MVKNNDSFLDSESLVVKPSNATDAKFKVAITQGAAVSLSASSEISRSSNLSKSSEFAKSSNSSALSESSTSAISFESSTSSKISSTASPVAIDEPTVAIQSNSIQPSLVSDQQDVLLQRQVTPAQTYGIDFTDQKFLTALTKTLDNFNVPEMEIATMDLRPAFHPDLNPALGGTIYSSKLIEEFFASLRLRNNPALINFNQNFIQDYFVKFNNYAQEPKYSFVVRDFNEPKPTRDKAENSGTQRQLLNARQKLIPTEWFGVLFINQQHQATSTYQLPSSLYFNEQGNLMLKANAAVELGLVDLLGVTNPSRYTMILRNSSNKEQPVVTSLETFMDLLMVYGEQRYLDFQKYSSQTWSNSKATQLPASKQQNGVMTLNDKLENPTLDAKVNSRSNSDSNDDTKQPANSNADGDFNILNQQVTSQDLSLIHI